MGLKALLRVEPHTVMVHEGGDLTRKESLLSPLKQHAFKWKKAAPLHIAPFSKERPVEIALLKEIGRKVPIPLLIKVHRVTARSPLIMQSEEALHHLALLLQSLRNLLSRERRTVEKTL